MVKFGIERIGKVREQAHLKLLRSKVTRAIAFGDVLNIKQAKDAYNYFKEGYANEHIKT